MNNAWYLDQVRAPAAWRLTRGANVTVAVIDQQIDTRHPEFDGRVLAGRDFASGSGLNVGQGWEPHGTKCAGLALAGGIRVTGVAPEARLLPVKVPALAGGVGDPTESEAIRWAAQNGADVICCAFGPTGPRPECSSLPGPTARAIDWAAEHGRGGKGCVVVFSAGNDDLDLARNGYASHPGVIAVGACDAAGKRCSYSNWGNALWCVFPSGDPARAHEPDGLVLSTTPVGSFLLGETFYAHTVGHTSAAAAGIAGLCALVLSANPDLTWREVKDVLRRSSVKIDPSGGGYDARGHSRYYGYGRPDAARAVRLAARARLVPSSPKSPHPSV